MLVPIAVIVHETQTEVTTVTALMLFGSYINSYISQQ